MDIAHCLGGIQDPFAIQLNDILEYPVRGRVRWSQVKRGSLFLQAAGWQFYMFSCFQYYVLIFCFASSEIVPVAPLSSP